METWKRVTNIRSIIQTCVALSVLLLPLAHLKVVIFGMPLYSVEMPILVALGVYCSGWWRGEFSLVPMRHFRNLLILGATLFVLGAISSFVVNPFSSTGLGMLKTWFGAPLALVWLWLQMKPEKEDTEKIVWAWFAAIVGVAVLSSLYVAQGLFTYDGRLSGWYQSPNYLAIFLAPGPFLVHYVYFRLPLSKKTKIYKLALLLSLILFVGLLFLTHSYATWLGIAVAGCLFLAVDTTVIAPWRKKLVGVLLLGIILGTFIFLESGNEKWQSLVSMQERSSFTSREMIWQAATKIISDHPLFGIGLGRFQEVYLSYQKYYPPYLEWAVPQPHNIVLAVWLQTGVLGLVGFALLVFQAVILLIKNKSRESVLLLGLLALYLIYGIFDTPFFKTDLAFSFWLIIGLTLALPKPELHKQ